MDKTEAKWYHRNFGDKVHASRHFDELVRAVTSLPGGPTESEIFRGYYRLQVYNWRTGKQWPPQWAVEALRAAGAKARARIATNEAMIRSGPGRVGTRANLKPFRQL